MNNLNSRSKNQDDGICFALAVVACNLISSIALVWVIWFIYSLLTSSRLLETQLAPWRTF